MTRFQSSLRRWHSLPLAFAVVCCGMYVATSVPAWPSSLIQEEEKVFEKLRPSHPEPTEMVEIRTTKKAVKLGEKFDEGDDWLNGATFKLKNTSGKEIVYVELDLNFPETTSSGNEMSFPLKLGRRPGESNSTRAPLLLKPGEDVGITLGEKKYEELTRFIETRQPISNLTKVRVSFGFVVFNDGTAWSAGNFYRQDPNNPKRYINLGTSLDTPLNN